jgi:protein-tyrosine phosphatase
MKYAATFFLMGACWLAVAALNGGWWWLLAWPGAGCLFVGLAYALRKPALLGKRPDGTFHPASLLLLSPYFFTTWGAWHVLCRVLREQAGEEVAPGVYVGRRPFSGELPDDVRLVVDMTGEFLPARGVRGAGGRSYFCVPTLDGSAPPDSALANVLERIAARGDAEGSGSVYIHCAQGRGRSAALAAAVLIARGLASNVDEAEKLMARARPVVRLNAAQRAWVTRVTRSTAG